MSESVKVIVRCRPMSSKEQAMNCKCPLTLTGDSVTINNYKDRDPIQFTFDAVYDWNSTQQQIYEETIAPIVENVLKGYNGTIFAYGQTGSGKTWTIEGMPTKELQGIIPNSFEHIFNVIALDESTKYLVRVSFIEIYKEKLRDLLTDQKTDKVPMIKQKINDNGELEFYVFNQSSVLVSNANEIRKLLNLGSSRRTRNKTEMNDVSSRSHAIFTITVELASAVLYDESESENFENVSPLVRVGRLNLVDLAGSERQKKTKADQATLKEGASINYSLSVLGNVINAIVEKQSHVPFRESNLTMVLKNSLGGSCKTLMCANISPADYNIEESLSTLIYANRAKMIKNKPRINEDPKDALLRQYQDQIKMLRETLEQAKQGKLSFSMDNEVFTELRSSGFSQSQIEQLENEKETEIARILKEQGYNQQEISHIQEQLTEFKEKTKEQEQARKTLEKQLQAIQKKIIGGASSLLTENERKKALLQQQRLQIEAKAQEELRLRRQFEENTLQHTQMIEQVTEKEKERNTINQKLRTLYLKYQHSKQELMEEQERFSFEREELMKQIREINAQMDLSRLIIRSFIPSDEVAKLSKRVDWDEKEDKYQLRPLESSPAKQLETFNSVDFRSAHPVLHLTFDLPERTTEDYSFSAAKTEADLLTQHVEMAIQDLKTHHADADIFLKDYEDLPFL